MSTATLSGPSLTAVHRAFEAALPVMDRTIKFQFRNWPRRHRAEAVTDARAAAWHAWSGLARRAVRTHSPSASAASPSTPPATSAPAAG